MIAVSFQVARDSNTFALEGMYQLFSPVLSDAAPLVVVYHPYHIRGAPIAWREALRRDLERLRSEAEALATAGARGRPWTPPRA